MPHAYESVYKAATQHATHSSEMGPSAFSVRRDGLHPDGRHFMAPPYSDPSSSHQQQHHHRHHHHPHDQHHGQLG